MYDEARTEFPENFFENRVPEGRTFYHHGPHSGYYDVYMYERGGLTGALLEMWKTVEEILDGVISVPRTPDLVIHRPETGYRKGMRRTPDLLRRIE